MPHIFVSRWDWQVPAFIAILCLLAEVDRSFGETKAVDEEVMNKWKAYGQFSRSLQGVARKSITRDAGKMEKTEITFKQNRDCTLSCLSNEQSPTEIYRIGNTRYAANIKREKEDHSQVVLDKFTEDPYSAFPGFSGKKVSIFDLNYSVTSPHFTVGSLPLSALVIDPMFKCLKVSRELENGQELIRIDYTISHSDPKTENESKSGGSLFLDPSRCWCLRKLKTSSTVTLKGAAALDSEREIDFTVIEHPSGFPIIDTQVSRDHIYSHKTKKRSFSTTKTVYELKVDDDVPDSEFTLSAFGLPEPAGGESLKKSVPLYVWILLAAGVCAALSLGFRHLVRRARFKPAV